MLSRLFALFLLAAPIAVFGQTLTYTQQCAGSLRGDPIQPNNDQEVYLDYSTTDTSSFQISYTYNATACSGVTLNKFVLNYGPNTDFFANCASSATKFDATGALTVTCATTKGNMAAQTPGGTTEFDILYSIGTRPNIVVIDTYFGVNDITPAASPGARRRRRAIEAGLILPDDFSCAAGSTACPVPGRRGLWECLDLSSDINACGGCPGTEASQDCAILSGADEVVCVAGTCAIQSCDRYHVPAIDGRSCIRIKANLRFQQQ